MSRCRYCLGFTTDAFCSAGCEKDMTDWAENPTSSRVNSPLPEFLAKQMIKKHPITPELKAALGEGFNGFTGEWVYENFSKHSTEAFLERLNSPGYKGEIEAARRGEWVK